MIAKTFAADTKSAAAVIDFIGVCLAHHPASVKNRAFIAVDEIFSNIARHAYGADCGDVLIEIDIRDKTLITFTDSGAPFDPLAYPCHKPDDFSADSNVKGLGIFLLKNAACDAVYNYADGKNVLSIGI